MSRGTDTASKVLGTAAAAANVVPVYGQFAAIGLGIAAGLTKLFGNIDGPRKRKRREAQARFNQGRSQKYQTMQGAQQAPGGGGQLQTGGAMPQATTGPVMDPTPLFNGGLPQSPPTGMNNG